MASPYAQFARKAQFTAQTKPIPGREAEMVPNDAGGYGFVLDDWARLHRFLILGSTGGTYYVGEGDLTAQNAEVAIRCIGADGVRAVESACEVNLNNRAPKVDQQLFVMALALKYGNQATKNRVTALMPGMLRTGTHVLHFAAMLDSLGGWNATKRRIIGNWLTGQDADRLAFQFVKYQQRDGWSVRDLLRVAHPQAPSEAHRALFDWVCKRPGDENEAMPGLIRSYQAVHGKAHELEAAPWERALFGIGMGLPREALPTEGLKDERVVATLLPHMPAHALLRNLGSMTSDGLKPGMVDVIVGRLQDAAWLRKARVHPFAVLLAQLIYASGSGVRGNKVWTPDGRILGALEDAYDAAFDAVQPTGKRILVGVDVSGSMQGAQCQGTPITAAVGAGALAITLARLEPHALVVGFTNRVKGTLTITKRTSPANTGWGYAAEGTDVAAPILGALQGGAAFDAFVLITDGETWAGKTHVTQALADYRRKVVPNAKLVGMAMAANKANVVDPLDPLQLGVAGLDANVPGIVAEFIAG